MVDPIILYSIVGISFIPIIIKVLISLEFIFKRNSISRREYNTSRGTIHKKMLHDHLKKLKNLIKKEENLLKKYHNKQSSILKDKTDELEKAATIYIFERDFTSIPGIGKKLKERIRRNVFNGTLDSLYRSSRVQGIGETKYTEICYWVKTTKHSMSRIIESKFSGKKEIIKKYEKQLVDIEKDIQKVQKILSPLHELEKKSESEIITLDKVTIGIFVKSYKGDEEASKIVTEYHLGLFPEWRQMPSWFKNLLEATS